MALAFSEKFRASIGGKAFRVYEVTHDGSETSIGAADFDLEYFVTAWCTPGTGVLSAGSTATFDLTTASGVSLGMTALSSGSIAVICAIGY